MWYHFDKVCQIKFILRCHRDTISYQCASIIADSSNTWQRKNPISYLLSSLWRQHHHSTSLTTTDPLLHDGSSRMLALEESKWTLLKSSGPLAQVASFRLSFGSAAGSRALRRRPAWPLCGGGWCGRRGWRGCAACRSAGRLAAGPAGGCSCKGKGWKTGSVMIWMNALIDLEYAAGTLSGERSDAQSTYSVQTAAELFNKGWNLYVPTLLKTALYILCTYLVHTEYIKFILSSYWVHTWYIQN